MRSRTLLALLVILGAIPASAQTPLDASPDGLVNVQKLTCDQLANTFQEDADALAMYYGGLV